METAALERYKQKHSVIKLTPRAELERKKAKPLTKVLEVLDVEQSAFKIDGVQAGQEGRRGIHVVGKIWEMKVSEVSEVEQIYWSAFETDRVWGKLTLAKHDRKEGGAPLLWATWKREVQGAPPVAGYIQGVGGVGGRTGYLLLPVGTGWADILECIGWRWNPSSTGKRHSYIGVGGVGGRTAKQYRKAGGAGDTHVEGHI
ncbi:hypothetical protein B0H14DRAFT_2633740 [Mycena olivaceomarginata]|nr:hypothetical protein B0H14DRAFT_2633740 [Mycena olivaceomarginata]